MKLCILILILFCFWQAKKLDDLSIKVKDYDKTKGLLSDPKIRKIMCVEGSKGK